MTHICVSKQTIIGSDNGLVPANAGILLIGTLGTNFSEILIEIRIFSFTKMGLKVSSAKWRPFCLGLNVLKNSNFLHGTSVLSLMLVTELALLVLRPGTRPTNDISIKFEIQPKFAVLWFEIYSTDHNEILHTSRQLHCRDVCKISLWSV